MDNLPDPKVIKEWLDKADEDFGFAAISFADSANTYFGPICFHFQQAAEKYLKAYIVGNDLEFEKVHDLKRLLGICKGNNPNFAQIYEECIFLNRFYIEPRYPVLPHNEVSGDDTRQAKEAAEKIGDFVKQLLSVNKNTLYQKGIAPIIILIAVVVIAGLGGAYYFGTQVNKPTQPQSTIQPSPTQPQTLSPTTASKSFTGIGFTFQYSPYFEVFDIRSLKELADSFGIGSSNELIVGLIHKRNSDDSINRIKLPGTVLIITRNKTDAKDVNELAAKEGIGEIKRVGPHDVLAQGSDVPPANDDTNSYVLVHNGFAYRFHLQNWWKHDDKEQIIKYFDQILSTFSFTE